MPTLNLGPCACCGCEGHYCSSPGTGGWYFEFASQACVFRGGGGTVAWTVPGPGWAANWPDRSGPWADEAECVACNSRCNLLYQATAAPSESQAPPFETTTGPWVIRLKTVNALNVKVGFIFAGTDYGSGSDSGSGGTGPTGKLFLARTAVCAEGGTSDYRAWYGQDFDGFPLALADLGGSTPVYGDDDSMLGGSGSDDAEESFVFIYSPTVNGGHVQGGIEGGSTLGQVEPERWPGSPVGVFWETDGDEVREVCVAALNCAGADNVPEIVTTPGPPGGYPEELIVTTYRQDSDPTTHTASGSGTMRWYPSSNRWRGRVELDSCPAVPANGLSVNGPGRYWVTMDGGLSATVTRSMADGEYVGFRTDTVTPDPTYFPAAIGRANAGGQTIPPTEPCGPCAVYTDPDDYPPTHVEVYVVSE